jgi:hypothetical protein
MKVNEAHCWKWKEGQVSWGNTGIDDRFKQFPWIIPLVTALRNDAELTKKRWTALFFFDFRSKRTKIKFSFKTRSGRDVGKDSSQLGPRRLPGLEELKHQMLSAA